MHMKFLASYPKSGNTWMRVLLEGYLKGEKPSINSLNIVSSETGKELYNFGLQFDHGPSGWAASRLTALLRLAEISRYPAIYKTHIANMKVNDIPAFPDNFVEKAVYIVRDPRDVVLSYGKHLGYETTDQTIELMKSDGAWDNGSVKFLLSSWPNHVKSWMNASFPVALLRYEDLLVDTEGVLAQVVKFFQFPYDKKRLKQAVKWAKFENLKKEEEEEGFRERSQHSDSFFHVGKAGRWKEVFGDNPPKFDDELMKELGYEV